MRRLDVGDRVRIDIPEESDLDHESYHGRHGTVAATIDDDVGMVTGDERDSMLYRVELDSGETADFRWRDLRPPFDE